MDLIYGRILHYPAGSRWKQMSTTYGEIELLTMKHLQRVAMASTRAMRKWSNDGDMDHKKSDQALFESLKE